MPMSKRSDALDLLRKRLKARFPRRQDAVDAIGCSPSAVAMFLNRKRGFGLTYISRACAAVGTTLEELEREVESASPNPSSRSYSSLSLRPARVLLAGEIGLKRSTRDADCVSWLWSGFSELATRNSQLETLLAADSDVRLEETGLPLSLVRRRRADSEVFALRVVGTGLSPRAMKGDFLLVERCTDWSDLANGDLAIALLEDADSERLCEWCDGSLLTLDRSSARVRGKEGATLWGRVAILLRSRP